MSFLQISDYYCMYFYLLACFLLKSTLCEGSIGLYEAGPTLPLALSADLVDLNLLAFEANPPVPLYDI